MADRAAILTEAARLRAGFEAAGARPVETPILQPADLLLDLYGEDIRARAYVTWDALRGEQMLRPDFTVPVVQLHLATGAEPARYTYSGEVFRRQEQDAGRPNEYLQVGYEVFDRQAPEAADAEVFALFAQALAAHGLRAATGDIGVLMAAVQGLDAKDRRKAALMRHIWRPKRFRALLDRFAGRRAEWTRRLARLADDTRPDGVPEIGLRSRAEVDARLELLRAEAQEPPIPQIQLSALEAVLETRGTLPAALERLADIAVDLPAIAPALERLRRRVDALAHRHVDVGTLDFEGSYGRTQMEYYDGFVFGFYADDRPDLPPLATGGRYDALTRRLGGGAEIPAVGGVIRPDLVLALREATS